MSETLQWDPRLTARGVVLHTIATTPGQLYWRVARGQWFSTEESGGRRHLYIETLDETGRPLPNVSFRVAWPSGATVALTNGYAGFDAGNFPMSPSRNEFEVTIADGLPSERVTGLGMGVDTPQGFNPGAHSSTLLRFQRVTQGAVPEPPPTPPPTVDTILDALYDARTAIDAAISRYLARTAAP